MSSEFAIGSWKADGQHSPFIIAEMSGNHNQSLERALAIVDAAAEAGVHALKIQTYTADTMTLDVSANDFMITDTDSPWRGNSLYHLYQRAFTPWEWHREIFDRCRKHGILGFSTPFDITAVDFLETFDVSLYKIASFENIDLQLIKKAGQTGKPLIISTGLATEEEIGDAVQTARQAGCRQLMLLKCTSAYPATAETANLQTIPDMQKKFGCPVGLSDHTLGLGVALASIGYGAVAIEKHFTLSRADGGVDAAFSLEPAEMKQLVRESRSAWQAQGHISYGPSEAEKISLRFRRSLYVAQDIKAGDVVTEKNVRVVRPGYGLHPKHYESIMGRKIKRQAKRGDRVTWDLLE